MKLSEEDLGKLAVWSGEAMHALRLEGQRRLGRRLGGLALVYLSGVLETCAKHPKPENIPPEIVELLDDAYRWGKTHAAEGARLADMIHEAGSNGSAGKPGLVDGSGNPIEGAK